MYKFNNFRILFILGRYRHEYLLRKIAEGSGQSTGEFYTPREVAILMAQILDPEPGEEIYDPCCGSGGLIIKCALQFREKYHNDLSVALVQFYGQENQHGTFAMAKMNTFIHDMEAHIALHDLMTAKIRVTDTTPRPRNATGK